MRKLYTNNQCYMCRKYLVQPEVGRTRFFCNNACKQKFYRFQKRAKEGRGKRVRKQKAKALHERKHPIYKGENTVLRITEFVRVMHCAMCGEKWLHYGKRKPKKYCTEKCRKRAKRAWEKVADAYYEVERQQKRGWRDEAWIISDRMMEGYLSPICPTCGGAFALRVGKGRKKIYCSAQCREKAYEERYKAKHGRKRTHRYANCPVCEERFYRFTPQGNVKHYCNRKCQQVAKKRRQVERNRQQREAKAMAQRIERGKEKERRRQDQGNG